MGEHLVEVEFVDSTTKKSYTTYLSPADVKRAGEDKEFSQSILIGLMNSELKEGNASESNDTMFIEISDPKLEMPVTNEKLEDHYTWTHEQILCLIDAYAMMQKDGRKKLNRNQWTLISQEMLKNGYNISSTKCSIKFDSLKRRYKKILMRNHEAENEHSTFQYFDKFDALFNKQSEIQNSIKIENCQDNNFGSADNMNDIYEQSQNESDEPLYNIEEMPANDNGQEELDDSEEELLCEYEEVITEDNGVVLMDDFQSSSKKRTESFEDLSEENVDNEFRGHRTKRLRIEIIQNDTEEVYDSALLQEQPLLEEIKNKEFSEEELEDYCDEQSTREPQPKQRYSHRLDLLEKILEEKRLGRKLREEYCKKKLILFEKLVTILTNR